ncbi:hypothetical protein CLOM_g1792 [Closterium sp. NIES-68]|nr:hypothetical protein CLOM_g1792 [Closterium sp. NIES-68]GJP75163.1 hypothetical protein CLOP_g5646 [Closterium sp. NIES-67]GJP82315.1 hypothetical protein CLOP_g12568 [Closterium sp. NIES-67]
MNFISESQLEENKRVRGERVEDGTVTVDRPLYEILREQKEKKEAEHKEKFKNRPPRALDEDELEFLEAVAQKQREDEKEKDDEDKRALTEFQAALLSRTVTVDSHSAPETAPPSQASAPSGSSGSSLVATIRKRKEPDLPLIPRMGVKVQLKAKPKAKAGAPAPQSKSNVSNSPKALSRGLDGTNSTVEDASITCGQGKGSGEEDEATRQKQKVMRTRDVESEKDGGSLVGSLGLGAYGSDDDDDEDNE